MNRQFQPWGREPALQTRLIQYLDQGLQDELPLGVLYQIQTRADGAEMVMILKVVDMDALLQVEQALHRLLNVVYQHWSQTVPAGPPDRALKAVIPPEVLQGPPDQDSPQLFPLQMSVGTDIRFQHREIPPHRDTPRTLVLKGGGIKGLAYIGAWEVLENRQTFDRFLGTSAGAIFAVLLAAGFSANELKTHLLELDFRMFFDARPGRRLWNLLVHRGVNPGKTLTDWLDLRLAEKCHSPTRVHLADLPYRATVLACQRDTDVVAFDSYDNDAPASHAVRCSMSIPFVFAPSSHHGLRTYDGGMRYNYPLPYLLQDDPHADFVGLYLGSETYQPGHNRWEMGELLDIWTTAADQRLLQQYRGQTVIIDPQPIGTLDQDLSLPEKHYLLQCGRVGAWAYLAPGSEQHQQAIAKREQLRKHVDRYRQQRQVRRKTRQRLGLILALVVMACGMGWLMALG